MLLPVLSAMRSRIVWSFSTSMSSVTVTARFWVRLPDGVKVTDFVAIRKSPGLWALCHSVAVPPVRSSTATVMEDCGLWLTCTGTFNIPPDTFSATLTVCAVVRPAVPKPMVAAAASSSVIVTVAVPCPETTAQPETEVVIVAVNVSSPSTRASFRVGTRNVAVELPELTRTVDGGELRSADVAALPEYP